MKADAKLATETEIRERLLSVRRQRDRLDNSGCRRDRFGAEHIDDLRKRWAKAAALTAREDALRVMLAAVLTGGGPGMREIEKTSLRHAAEELRYQRGPQAEIDRLVDRTRRIRADRQTGHLPGCSLTKCLPGCPREKE